jgi:hypothetical protein
MNTNNQQIERDVEISNPKNVSQDHFNSDLKIDHNKIKKLENQSVMGDEDADRDASFLPLWFGDPKLDVLTAEEWIGSVRRAKIQSEWNDLVSISLFHQHFM